MSSDEAAGDRDDPDRDRTIILRAADTFDGRDHVMSAAAFELHLMAIAHSTANDRLGFVPDESLSSFTGEALRRLGAEPATLAAELCTVGMWVSPWPSSPKRLGVRPRLPAAERTALAELGGS